MEASRPNRTSAPTSIRAAIFIAIAIAGGILCGRGLELGWKDVARASFPNPDSYYKLVLLESYRSDAPAEEAFHFVRRDNWPDGNWLHWSVVHTATIWQLHRPFVAAGIERKSALRYAGAALTLLSLLALASFVAIAVARIGPARSIMLSGLVLTASGPLYAYGIASQITHHIFMLVPLAAAAACVFQTPTCRHRPVIDFVGGMFLGLALWISPETMPFVVGLIYVRVALRVQFPVTAPLWPISVGLVIASLSGWLIDPPPPGFGAWALDHISLAYLLLALLLATVTWVTDQCARRRLPFTRQLMVLGTVSIAAMTVWVVAVPNVLLGPSGTVPAELRPLFWNHVNELRSPQQAHEWLRFCSLPICAALLAGIIAVRQRLLWLGALAVMALAYALLAGWHVRMGAAAAVIAALALSAATTMIRAFDPNNDHLISRREAVGATCLAVIPHLQLAAVALLGLLWPAENQELRYNLDVPQACALDAATEALNSLPPGTILSFVSNGPELLYRTHHNTVAGPYHRNSGGMLDIYRFWLDTEDDRAREIVLRRQVDYVLGCVRYQRHLRAESGPPTLAQRLAESSPPPWLEPLPWPDGMTTGLKLFRVDSALVQNSP